MADESEGSSPEMAGAGVEAPFQSLYRRYRPQHFADVKGQDHVTRALRNAVRDGKVAHAYLFSGPRGTGKTSTARILAMALNCEHPVDGEPDGVCLACREVRRGSSLDVHELDAASNRRIDEMRDLLSRVALGTMGRWKVYIIDEVHQLTPDAASALLKTLEDPPAHVVFVLATTDPQKVLPTIRSRTQHFEFRLLSSDVLGDLLREVNGKAALGVAPEAIDLVVRRGHGSARDALSVLDQVAAAGVVEDEATVVGEITDALAERDAGRVLIAVAEALSAGRDARRLGADMLDHLRNGFLATQARQLVLLADDAVAEVEAQAHRIGLPGVVRAMEVVGQALVDMRDSVDPRITLEVALVRLTHPDVDASPAALVERMDRLERAIHDPPRGGGQAAAPPSADIPTAGDQPGGGQGADQPRIRTDPPVSTHRIERPPPREPPPRGSLPRPGPSPSAEPPGPPGPAQQRAGGSRSTLGAHRRPATPAPGREGEVAQGPAPAATEPSPIQSTAVSPDPRTSTNPRTSVGGAPEGLRPDEVAEEPTGAQSTDPPMAGPTDPPTPGRDDLTAVWGDTILPGLPGHVRAYLAAGRFVSVDGATAVYALPDAPLLSRAERVKGEAEAALSAHFRRPVRIRLIHDQHADPVPADPVPAEPAGLADQPSSEDLEDLQDAGPAVVSPEQRLLEAFPGAQEVNP